MQEASRELLASREDVWAFFVEPNHLSDWWPGIVGVQADRRGFATGARWQVSAIEGTFAIGGATLVDLPRAGRPSGPKVAQTLLITEIAQYLEWSWRLIPSGSGARLARPLEVRITLAAAAPDRTVVTIGVGRSSFGAPLLGSRDRRLARNAVNRLYDLVQTTATL